MKIQVMPEHVIERYEEDSPHIVISIASPGSSGARLPDNVSRIDLLRLYFHDIESIDPPCLVCTWLKMAKVEPVLFSSNQAILVAGFVKKHLDAPLLIVNCEAGISRSSGVAAAVSKALMGHDEKFYIPPLHPNEHVRKMVLEEMLKTRSKP